MNTLIAAHFLHNRKGEKRLPLLRKIMSFEHDDLINLNNVILTPHIGSATVETRYDMGKLVYDNIVQMLTTNTTISPVN